MLHCQCSHVGHDLLLRSLPAALHHHSWPAVFPNLLDWLYPSLPRLCVLYTLWPADRCWLCTGDGCSWMHTCHVGSIPRQLIKGVLADNANTGGLHGFGNGPRLHARCRCDRHVLPEEEGLRTRNSSLWIWLRRTGLPIHVTVLEPQDRVP